MKANLTILWLLLLLTTYCSTAQNPGWLWAKSHGSSGSDASNTMISDPSGSGAIYVAGTFQGPSIVFGATTLTGTNDIFLAKYDANGAVLWAKSIKGTGMDFVTSITADLSGNIYLAGTFMSDSLFIGTDTLVTYGSNMLLAKYSSAGNVLWGKSPGKGVIYGITAVPNGSGTILITGILNGSLVLGTDSISDTSFGLGDIFIGKMDANGNGLWAKSGTSTGVDVAYAVTADAAGNGFIAGAFFSDTVKFGNKWVINSAGYDAFVVKYDVNGNVKWAKSAAGSSADQAFAMLSDPLGSGSIYVAGSFNSPKISFGSTTLTNADTIYNYSDLFLVKIDSSGDLQWARKAGSYLDEAINALAADAAGNIYAAGYFSGTSMPFAGDTLVCTNYYMDALVLKYSPAGNELWALGGGGADDEKANGIALNLASAGQVYIAGSFKSTSATFGSTILTNQSVGANTDMFVSRVSGNIAGIAAVSESDNRLLLYPNPAAEAIAVRSTSFNNEVVTVSVLNLLGKTMKEEKISWSNDARIDIEALSAGIYFLQLKSASDAAVRRFIKK